MGRAPCEATSHDQAGEQVKDRGADRGAECMDGLPPVSGRAVGIVGLMSGLCAISLATGVAYADFRLSGHANAGLMLFVGVLGMGLPLLLFARRARWGWRGWGFRRPRHSALHLLWQIPTAILSSLLITAIAFTIVGGSPAKAGSTTAAFSEGSLLTGALAAVAAIVLAPLIEEMLFRRLILDWLRRRLPVPAAVLICAGLFAAVHVVPQAMVYVGLVGLWATLLRVWSGALWHSVALHAANNSLVAAIVISSL